jgi:Gamma tubulin complex component N-terminal
MGRAAGERHILARDLINVLAGVDSSSVRVCGMEEPRVAVDPLAADEDASIVYRMADIILGVRETEGFCVKEFYGRDGIKQGVSRALDLHMQGFFEKVISMRRAFVGGELSLDSLCFVLEEDLYLFREIRSVLQEAEKSGGGRLLALLIRRAEIALGNRKLYGSIVCECLKAFNGALSSFLEGKKVELDMFIVRERELGENETYGFDESYWSKIFEKVEENIPDVLAPHAERIITAAKAMRLISLDGSSEHSRRIPPLLHREGWSVSFDSGSFDALYSEIMGVAVSLIKPGMEASLKIIRGTFLFESLSRFTALFEEMGERLFKSPDEKMLESVNHIMKHSDETRMLSAEIDSLESSILGQRYGSLSIADASAFDLPSEIKQGRCRGEEEYIFTPVPFASVVMNIHNADLSLSGANRSLSLLQGMDVLFAPNPPFSLFFTPKSLAGYRMVFRLLYSLYALEYFFGRVSANRRVRQMILVFASGMRMFVSESVVKSEWIEFSKVTEIDEYIGKLEESLRQTLQGALLTNRECIEAYDKFFRISFSYLETERRDMMSGAEIDALVSEYQKTFRTLHAHLNNPFLISFVGSLLIEEE